MTAYVYLLHFGVPYPAGRKPRHYLGVSRDVNARLIEHRAGNPGKKGSLCRAVAARGISIEVVRTWEFEEPRDAFDFERVEKKKKKNYASICPVCEREK